MFQEITIIGNLGADAELRYTPIGIPVTSFRIAANRTWTDREGHTQTRTVWFGCTLWRERATKLAPYLKKGRLLLVKGTVEEPRVYADKEGFARASLELTVDNVKFLTANPDGPAGRVPFMVRTGTEIMETETTPETDPVMDIDMEWAIDEALLKTAAPEPVMEGVVQPGDEDSPF